MSTTCQRLQTNAATAFNWVTSNATKATGNLAWATGKTASCVLGVVALENMEECVRRVWEGMPNVANINMFGTDVMELQQEYLPDYALTYLGVGVLAAVSAKLVDNAGKAICKRCCPMAQRGVKTKSA